MARTVVAIYDNFQTANETVRELVDNGFPRDRISLIANNTPNDTALTGTTRDSENVADDTGAGAGVGAGIGAAIGGIGGLLIGLGALTIPGIGPVIAAGPLAVALSTLTGAGVGAVTGGVTGGLLGALIGLGIPQDEAEFYAEGVRRGGVLVTVQVDEQSTNQILDILNRHNPIDIHERAAQWRETGWKGYDANAPVDNSTTSPRQVNNPNLTVPATGAPASMPNTVERGADMRDFDPENPAYRDYYHTNLASTGYSYEDYVPAYRYGYGLASDARYQNSTWNVIEPNVRQDWERQHPGTWERFQASIRHAWENVTGQSNNPNRY